MVDDRGGHIEVANLAKSFDDRVIFENVSLSVPRGSVMGIIGPSGTGKSTFLRCINLLERPTRGKISIDGVAAFDERPLLGARQLVDYRRRVGMVFQQFNLFPNMTVLRNVTFPQVKSLGRPKSAADDRSRELLARVGLSEEIAKKPAQLSGGQQQRVAIARALALDPEVLLLDEPTSSIDPELRVEVRSVVAELAHTGVTMVLVTHELDFVAKVATHVAFMTQGGIAEQGPAQQVLSDPQDARTRRFIEAVTS